MNKHLTYTRIMLFAASITLTCFLAAHSQAQIMIKTSQPASFEKFLAITRPDVRSELKLSEAQNGEITELNKQFNAAMREFPNLESVSSAEEANEVIQEHQNKIDKKYGPLLTKVLNAEQDKRLNQISIQIAGPDILLREDIAKLLKLTDSQKSKMQELIDANLEKVMVLQPPVFVIQGETPPPPPKPNPEVPKLFAKTKLECVKLLNRDQADSWKQLIGPEFKIKEEK